MELLLQLLVNGLVQGAGYALIAIGFVIIWSTSRVFHLAHGGIFTLSGYLIYTYAVKLHLGLPVGVLLAVPSAAMIGIAIEWLVYRPLRNRGATSLTLLVASLATLILTINLTALMWGTESRRFDDLARVEGYQLGSAHISGIDIAMIVTGIVLFAGVIQFMKRTRYGRAMRAVADNEVMAQIAGVGVSGTYLAAYALGSALAVPAAFLLGMQHGLSPQSGMFAILMASAGTIVGGVGSIAGALLGSVLLAVAQNVGIWKLPSEWQESIAFGVLLIFIIVRPSGFFGAKVKGKGV